MSRERDIYRKMRQDAQESINSQPAFKPKPVKPNYLSAVVWTSVVAAASPKPKKEHLALTEKQHQ